MCTSLPAASTSIAMRSDGLRVEGPEPIHIARVNATDDRSEIGVVDYVMLCVKLWDTEAGVCSKSAQ
jgi:2-dehydropantoate 2-reductase